MAAKTDDGSDHLVDGTRYDPPTWDETCGRSSMSKCVNAGAVSGFGNTFAATPSHPECGSWTETSTGSILAPRRPGSTVGPAVESVDGRPVRQCFVATQGTLIEQLTGPELFHALAQP
ncbi:hypothetical protein AB0P07_27490 [Streptomyces sp. NPDC085944]|uniref:hypothetical protein n=1 Tax=Streptomyces sp. NPDC085944 TaxID=3154962 RepID=UPI00342651BF